MMARQDTADGATKADKATSATPASNRLSWVGVGGRVITLLAAVITSLLANISLGWSLIHRASSVIRANCHYKIEQAIKNRVTGRVNAIYNRV